MGSEQQKEERTKWRRWVLLSSASLAFPAPSDATLINLFEQEQIEAIRLRPKATTLINHTQYPDDLVLVNGMGAAGAPLRGADGRPTGNFLAFDEDNGYYKFDFQVPADINPANRFLDVSFDTWASFDNPVFSNDRETREERYYHAYWIHDKTLNDDIVEVEFDYTGNRRWERTEQLSAVELIPGHEYYFALYASYCAYSDKGIDNIRLMVDVIPQQLLAIPEPRSSFLLLLGGALLRSIHRLRPKTGRKQ